MWCRNGHARGVAMNGDSESVSTTKYQVEKHKSIQNTSYEKIQQSSKEFFFLRFCRLLDSGIAFGEFKNCGEGV